MSDEPATTSPEPRRYRGPQGLGEAAARALEQGARPGESLGGVEEATILHLWAQESGCLIPADGIASLPLVSNRTSEHEVRYREDDHRAVKKTWPGTYGLVPHKGPGGWMPHPATPGQYLVRQALQNELFGDDIRLEGVLVDDAPSMILGALPGGISLVISQPWLEAARADRPHPADAELSAFLADLGLEPLSGSFFGWHHPERGLIILDAKADNFILTEIGPCPIDLQIAELPAAA